MKALSVIRDLTITAVCVVVGYLALDEARDVAEHKRRRRLAAAKEAA